MLTLRHPIACVEYATVVLSGAPAPFYLAHSIPVNLTPNNYLVWRAHVSPLLENRYLEG
jgi:hypothetical protein